MKLMKNQINERMNRNKSSTTDITSNLPSNVTENILKDLQLRDAVRTSVLSRKWSGLSYLMRRNFALIVFLKFASHDLVSFPSHPPMSNVDEFCAIVKQVEFLLEFAAPGHSSSSSSPLSFQNDTNLDRFSVDYIGRKCLVSISKDLEFWKAAMYVNTNTNTYGYMFIRVAAVAARNIREVEEGDKGSGGGGRREGTVEFSSGDGGSLAKESGRPNKKQKRRKKKKEVGGAERGYIGRDLLSIVHPHRTDPEGER
ncbi:hypothetical protein RHMOL_Rhmol12G0087100 [Rhododendron molle]|uniref:Uncharacterized protein n=1 Tax=Rhododendron molle TaxID=49168 RepID=A0ACC0LFS9_RHOML|nr:hypothetical protein RHMOL_Rhmol12G0087100 [Rhododendron molle]